MVTSVERDRRLSSSAAWTREMSCPDGPRAQAQGEEASRLPRRRGPYLQQIVSRAPQRPFAVDLLFASEKKLYSMMSGAARKRAAEFFTKERHAGGYEQVLKKAVSSFEKGKR